MGKTGEVFHVARDDGEVMVKSSSHACWQVER
jgi:hypothetical protein